jgi:hypothetical protein
VRLKHPRAFRLTTALIGVSLGGGCSLIASQPPPTQPLRTMSECSDSRLPVYGDIYLAINTGALALVGLAGAAITQNGASNEIVPSWDPHPRSNSGVASLLTFGVVTAAATVGLIGSARYGLRSAAACQAAQLEFFRRGYEFPTRPPPPWR